MANLDSSVGRDTDLPSLPTGSEKDQPIQKVSPVLPLRDKVAGV